MNKFAEELFELMLKHNIKSITALNLEFLISSEKGGIITNANIKGYKHCEVKE